jgi:hypothetical protein
MSQTPLTGSRLMRNADRFRLFGFYLTPRFKYGAIVQDEARGDVVIVGLSDGRIPWPLGYRLDWKCGTPALVLYKGLAKAVQRESNQAVAHWWGVSGQTVTKWRKALGVQPTTKGTSRLRASHAKELGQIVIAQEKSRDPARDAPRREKIAKAKVGKPRPRHVHQALRMANLGRRPTKDARAKMSAAQRRRGARPPWIGPAWTPEEDELVRTLPAREAAKRTGRTLSAVYSRRSELRLPDARRRQR